MNSTSSTASQTIAGMERTYTAAVYVCDACMHAIRIVLHVYIVHVNCFQSQLRSLNDLRHKKGHEQV